MFIMMYLRILFFAGSTLLLTQMGCKVSVLKESTVNQNPVVFPLSLYQKALVQESWPIIENQALIFGTGVFYKYVMFATLFIKSEELRNCRIEWKSDDGIKIYILALLTFNIPLRNAIKYVNMCKLS